MGTFGGDSFGGDAFGGDGSAGLAEALASGAVAIDVLPDSSIFRKMADQATATDALSFRNIASLFAVANASTGMFTAAHLFNALNDLAQASTSIREAIVGILSDSATAAEAFTGIYKRFEHLRDFATATDVTLNSQRSAVSLLTTAVAMELLARGYSGNLADTAQGQDVLMESLRGVAALLAQAEASTLLVNNFRAVVLLSNSATAGDALTSQGRFLALLAAGADAAVLIKLGNTEYAAWVMNADNLATSQYQNFGFNSFVELPDGFYGAREDGLYRLAGNKDAGANIVAWIKSGLLDFGTGSLKSVPMMYIGLTSNGDMLLTVSVTSPEGAKTEYTYRMVERTANATREDRVKIGKGIRSVYWQWELHNTAGSDFAVDTTRFWPMVLSRRIR